MFVVYGAFTFGSAIVILAFMPTYATYAMWLPICGFTALTTLISANSLMQINSDPAVRGRVMGIYLLVFLGGAPLGSPLIGWTAEKMGVRPTLAACGGITIFAALFAFQRYRHKVEVPNDFSVDVVLPPPYENKS
jgi:MFS family permease